TNEVSVRASAGRSRISAPQNRIQRTTLALRDVAYMIEAHFDFTDKAGADIAPTLVLARRNRLQSQPLHRGRSAPWQRFEPHILPVLADTTGEIAECADKIPAHHEASSRRT